MYRALSALLTAIVLTGCTLPPEPAPSGQNGLVYIYRGDDGIHSKARLYVDGREVFDLAPSEYSFAYLPSGSHKIGVRRPDDYPNSDVISSSITVKAGDIRFFSCCTFVAAASSIDVTLADGLLEVGTGDGRRRVRQAPLGDTPPHRRPKH